MLGSSTIQNPRKELIIFCLISEAENEDPGEYGTLRAMDSEGEW